MYIITSEKKISIIFSLLLMAKDSETIFLDLANDFPQTEGNQTRHKRLLLKNVQTEDKESNNEMMEILKYMKSEIVSFKKKQEALEFANSPRLRKFHRLLDLSNNDMKSESLTSVLTSRFKNSPDK